jgi:phosphatidylglycerol---prolipoprotein diacylglyceryl transferase
LTLPFEPIIFGIKINIHLILEYVAFFAAFRYYTYLRKQISDTISHTNRLSIILGAIVGALIGSRFIGFVENPLIEFSLANFILLLNTKSIMGGLFGGLIGVETTKKMIKETQSSGDLFTFPIILGIIIGRIGCFLSGINEFTYGNITTAWTGMDLGDGALRHPTALYEIFFLPFLWLFLQKIKPYTQQESGLQFKIFMLLYFGFRFGIEFIKPNIFYLAGLSSIQWLCIVCWLYYALTIQKIIQHIFKKITHAQ